jgi:hypothetical protein
VRQTGKAKVLIRSSPGKRCGLSWSAQHLREVYPPESRSPKFFAGVDLDAARSCPVGIACSRRGWCLEECFRLCWDCTLLITRGKTAAARRANSMTPRVRNVLETRWNETGKQPDRWVWLAPTCSGHIEPSSLRKQHAKTFKALDEEAAKRQQTQQTIRAVFAAAHLSHAPGAIRLRRLDTGSDRWTLEHYGQQPLRTSFGRCGVPGHVALGWAQNWVHRKWRCRSR